MQLSLAQQGDRQEIARLIQLSTNAWYRRHGMGDIFPAEPDGCGLFVDVYRRLDPDRHWIVRDEQGVLCGSCFFHPRATHLGLGIMNVHPDYFGRGIAAQLIVKADELAGDLPIRLLSSALNLDSYALYHRAGFTPYAMYQDMAIPVPAEGFPALRLTRGRVRAARPDDLAGILQLERELLGIERRRDIDDFLNDAGGLWRTRLCACWGRAAATAKRSRWSCSAGCWIGITAAKRRWCWCRPGVPPSARCCCSGAGGFANCMWRR
ncbi:GNAT family N-acetyltransferase [Serratia ficaria]|uniref:GNAT family N-acetyltransferase n=2 Tax=Serratia ficaria TaxID=61651 RepID=UPI0021835B0A|nr:GNAT family N-acetyltransferase [Serratia ficaria]CAI2476273.1 Predicted acetyltransferase [Serratia ficaria]